jgi:hypothetical protein
LSDYFNPKPLLPPWVSWLLLSWVAVAKLITLPLLLIPWLDTNRGERLGRKSQARLGSFIGFWMIMLLPFLTHGIGSYLELLGLWVEALQKRGLPLESHNQSFAAFLYHYFSGKPTWVISRFDWVYNGWALLSEGSIQALILLWGFAVGVLLLFQVWKLPRVALRMLPPNVAGIIGLVILPSHLVWKPYFVFGIPIAALLSKKALKEDGWHSLWKVRLLWFVLFCMINLTTFDFIGRWWSAKFECANVLLWAHLILLVWLLSLKDTKMLEFRSEHRS